MLVCVFVAWSLRRDFVGVVCAWGRTPLCAAVSAELDVICKPAQENVKTLKCVGAGLRARWLVAVFCMPVVHGRGRFA